MSAGSLISIILVIWCVLGHKFPVFQVISILMICLLCSLGFGAAMYATTCHIDAIFRRHHRKLDRQSTLR